MRRFPAFIPDPESGIRLAAEELIRRGHRRFLYHAFALGQTPAYQLERYGAWNRILHEIAPNVSIVTADAPDAPALRALAQETAKTRSNTAILAANDGAAELWRRELAYCGASIPEDFAIIGYDGNDCFPRACFRDSTPL